MSDVTTLLVAARQGDKAAADAVFSLLYDELRRLAHAKLRHHQTMTLLNTTSLVHESYMRLVGSVALPVVDRRHYFAYAARVMRSVIVDFARARLAERRGGKVEHALFVTNIVADVAAPEKDVLRVHEALEVLAQADERLAQVVELRYFGGLTEIETAEALGVSQRTVRRDWDKARLLLSAALE